MPMDDGAAFLPEGPMTAAGRDVRLRPIGDADVPFLLEVYAATRADELARVPWTAEQKAAFVWMQFVAQHRHYQAQYPGAAFDVVMSGDEQAGRLYVHRGPAEIRIVDIALLPAHRAQCIGSWLLGALIEESIASGRRLTIHVERENRALDWYQRFGFELIRDEGVYLFMSRPPSLAADQVKIAS